VLKGKWSCVDSFLPFGMNKFVLPLFMLIYYSQVLEVDSKNVKALYRRAQAYIETADLDQAKSDIKKALEIDSNNRCAKSLVSFPVMH